ncbi:hypothetical protein MR772_01595, partial [bacterium]|nr:hypothetical protein [bacterium]
GYLLFDAAFRPSFVARLRLSPRLGRIFFNKQASNQLDAQLVIAICEKFSQLKILHSIWGFAFCSPSISIIC